MPGTTKKSNETPTTGRENTVKDFLDLHRESVFNKDSVAEINERMSRFGKDARGISRATTEVLLSPRKKTPNSETKKSKKDRGASDTEGDMSGKSSGRSEKVKNKIKGKKSMSKKAKSTISGLPEEANEKESGDDDKKDKKKRKDKKQKSDSKEEGEESKDRKKDKLPKLASEDEEDASKLKDKKKKKAKKGASEDEDASKSESKKKRKKSGESDDGKDDRKRSGEDKKGKKTGKNDKKKSAEIPNQEDAEKGKRHLVSRKSIEDDETFRMQLDAAESSKGLKIDSYEVEALLEQLPEHLWLIIPSIKWTDFREAKEKEIALKLEMEAIEAAAAATAAEAENNEEGHEEEMEHVPLHQRHDLRPGCTPNPCPCKERKRKRTPEVCGKEEPKKISPEDKCWEEYLERQREASKMRWFASVLVSAHKRRPNWIPPPEECLRLQHKMLQELERLAKMEEDGEGAGATEVGAGDTVEAPPEVLPPPEPIKSNEDDGKKKRKSSEKTKRGSAASGAAVSATKPLRKTESKKLSK